MHAHANEMHSLASKSTKFNPHFGRSVLLIIIPAKVEIKSCRFVRECVIYACMNVPTQLEFCLYDQIQVIANAFCRVGSQQFLSYR